MMALRGDFESGNSADMAIPRSEWIPHVDRVFRF